MAGKELKASEEISEERSESEVKKQVSKFFSTL